jgi:hypothetical protein
MSYYEDRIKALEAKVEEMALRERMKAIPVEAKLMDRIAELTEELKTLKEKMAKLPTRQIAGRWYTEGEFQQLIQDARIWRL